MKFVLMVKGKGNKPALKSLKVPVDSDFAQAVRNKEEAEQREKEQLKKLTLNIQQRMDEEERMEGT